MHRDAIDVTSNHRPDIRWKFVDSKGHNHRWFTSEVGVYVCKKCGEEVTPGYTSDNVSVYVAGLVCYTLKDRRISREEAVRFLSVFYPV